MVALKDRGRSEMGSGFLPALEKFLTGDTKRLTLQMFERELPVSMGNV